MCGILGYNFKSNYSLEKATKLLKNRGPDNTSTYNINNNYFGHTTLKIVDLNNNANQPMIFDDILIVHISEYSDTHVGQHSDTLVKIFSR